MGHRNVFLLVALILLSCRPPVEQSVENGLQSTAETDDRPNQSPSAIEGQWVRVEKANRGWIEQRWIRPGDVVIVSRDTSTTFPYIYREGDSISYQIDRTMLEVNGRTVGMALSNDVEEIIPTYPRRLRTIAVTGRGELDPVVVEAILEMAGPQFSLCLNLTRVSDPQIDQLQALAGRLEILMLRGPRFTDALLEDLAQFENLKTLYIWDTQISAEGLLSLSNLPNLNEVHYRTTLTTDVDFSQLSGLEQLRTLDFQESQMDDAGLAQISGLTQLTGVNLHATQVTDAGLAHLGGLTNLRNLDISENQVTDAGLAHLSGLSQIIELNLSNSTVGDAGLPHLSGLTELRKLWISSTRVTDAGLAHLSNFQHLGELNLAGTRVTDAGLAHLSGLRELRVLNLSRTQVESLAHLAALSRLTKLLCSDGQVGDSGLAHLSGLSELRELWFSRTQVSDASLAHLEGLSNLSFLALDSTQVTDGAARAFERAHPDLEVMR